VPWAPAAAIGRPARSATAHKPTAKVRADDVRVDDVRVDDVRVDDVRVDLRCGIFAWFGVSGIDSSSAVPWVGQATLKTTHTTAPPETTSRSNSGQLMLAA